MRKMTEPFWLGFAFVVYLALGATGVYLTTIVPIPSSLRVSLLVAFLVSDSVVSLTLIQELFEDLAHSGLFSWFVHGVLSYFMLLGLLYLPAAARQGEDLFGWGAWLVSAPSASAGLAVAASFIFVLLVYRLLQRFPLLKGIGPLILAMEIAIGAVFLWYAGIAILYLLSETRA